MNEFMNAIKNRRSIYHISNEQVITDDKLKELVETAVNYTPSSFHSQTSRVAILLGDKHKELWNITLNQLKAIVPAENFPSTSEKIASFAAGYGTILFFEEQDTIKEFQTNFALYADNFPVWSQQSSGMLQLVIWSALELEGYGASLQHYNPLIDSEVSKVLQLPSNWKLMCQMPFGKPVTKAGEKVFMPIENRVKVYDK